MLKKTSDVFKVKIEPPILKDLDDGQLMYWAQNGGFNVPYECHSQVIVKQITFYTCEKTTARFLASSALLN